VTTSNGIFSVTLVCRERKLMCMSDSFDNSSETFIRYSAAAVVNLKDSV